MFFIKVIESKEVNFKMEGDPRPSWQYRKSQLQEMNDNTIPEERAMFEKVLFSYKAKL